MQSTNKKRPRSETAISAHPGQQHDVFLHGLTSVEASRRWNVLIQRQAAAAASSLQEEDEEEEEDPFDCSDIAIPTTHVMTDRVLDEFAERWKQLDERRVAPPSAVKYHEVEEEEEEEEEEDSNDNDEQQHDDEGNNNNNTEKSSSTTTKKKKRKYWAAGRPRQILMPEQFDYATRQSEPPPDTEEESDRILSLLDPTVTLSYPRELWKLFQQVPTLSELEDQAVSGHTVPHISRLHSTILEENRKSSSSIGSDKFALSRLRSKDRHDVPPAVRLLSNDETTTTTTTITMECWTTGLKQERAPMSSNHRAVLEFQATQTLADVHQALVELSRDDLWKQHQTTTEPSSLDDSGYFFIEGVFYTTGSVDYVTPIQEWLQQQQQQQQQSQDPSDNDSQQQQQQQQQQQRASYMGIVSNNNNNASTSPLPVLSMSEIKLQDLSLRLGIRYHHVHHGDVECAVFVVDRRHGSTHHTITTQEKRSSSNNNHTPTTTAPTVSYPILHDIWTPSSKHPECDACRKAIAGWIASNLCTLTQGNRALCQRCCHVLLGSSSTCNASNSDSSMIVKESDSSKKKASTEDDGPTDDSTTAAVDTTATPTATTKKTMIQPFAMWRLQADISVGAITGNDPNKNFFG